MRKNAIKPQKKVSKNSNNSNNLDDFDDFNELKELDVLFVQPKTETNSQTEKNKTTNTTKTTNTNETTNTNKTTKTDSKSINENDTINDIFNFISKIDNQDNETQSQSQSQIPKKEKVSDFDIIQSVINKKIKPSQEQKESFSMFLFMMLLSNHSMTIDFAHFFNCNDISSDVAYDMINNIIPKNSGIGFLKFPKSEKIKGDDIDIVVDYYSISLTKAKEYIELLYQINTQDSLNELNKLRNIYKDN